jgi:hypothetical protein
LAVFIKIFKMQISYHLTILLLSIILKFLECMTKELQGHSLCFTEKFET